MRTVLHQVWATLYVEFVVKNPLAPVEHSGGVAAGGSGVGNELFEGGLESFMVWLSLFSSFGCLFRASFHIFWRESLRDELFVPGLEAARRVEHLLMVIIQASIFNIGQPQVLQPHA
jgi:hypothetical protein